jgi:alkylation response protein AidB-like acyl-CoA dehydrogenase
MEELHRLTVDYLKTRQQFGVAIGSFQALQHRAADMLVAVEQARSMAMYAAMMAEQSDAAERRPAIAAAKAQVNRSARSVGQEAVQLHGGIAMTWEYKAGHYFKRLTAAELMFGDTDHHLRAVMEAGGLVEEV